MAAATLPRKQSEIGHRNHTIFSTNGYVLDRTFNNFCGQGLCHRDTRWSMRTCLQEAQIKYAALGQVVLRRGPICAYGTVL